MVSFLLWYWVIAFGNVKSPLILTLAFRRMETGQAERNYGRVMFKQEYSRSTQKDSIPQSWWSIHFLQSARTAEIMDLIPADVEYRGNRIVWDARQLPGTPLWTGRAAVVLPADAAGVKRIYRIPDSDDPFDSEQAVREHLIGAAKDWIDCRIDSEESR